MVSAAACISDSVIRFVYFRNIHSWTALCFNLYLILFAVFLICCEFVPKFTFTFYFMNFAWGKASFNFFVASLMLGSGMAVLWTDILFGVYFLVLGIAFTIVSFTYRGSEASAVNNKLA